MTLGHYVLHRNDYDGEWVVVIDTRDNTQSALHELQIAALIDGLSKAE